MKSEFTILQLTVLFISIMGIFSDKCPVKRCAVTGTEFKNSTCVTYHQDTTSQVQYYEVDNSRCNSTVQHCPFIFYTDQDMNCQNKDIDKWAGIDGTHCNFDRDCYSGACNKEKNVCLGKGKGKSCAETKECAIGLFCERGAQCAPQLPLKASCISDTDCQNNLGCYEGVCIALYSLDDGTKVLAYQYELCKSGVVRDNQCVTTELHSPEECTGNTTVCNYSYSVSGQAKQEYTLPCVCSTAYADRKFCPYAANSSPHKNDLVPALKAFHNGESMKLHTLERNKYDSNLLWKVYQVRQHPEYKDADECIKKMLVSSNYIYVQFGLMLLLAMIFA